MRHFSNRLVADVDTLTGVVSSSSSKGYEDHVRHHIHQAISQLQNDWRLLIDWDMTLGKIKYHVRSKGQIIIISRELQPVSCSMLTSLVECIQYKFCFSQDYKMCCSPLGSGFVHANLRKNTSPEPVQVRRMYFAITAYFKIH